MRDEGGEREKVRLGWVRVLRTQEEARIGNWVRGERERERLNGKPFRVPLVATLVSASLPT